MSCARYIIEGWLDEGMLSIEPTVAEFPRYARFTGMASVRFFILSIRSKLAK
jgi:hypothetical protein